MKQLIFWGAVVLFLVSAGFSGLANSADHLDPIEVVVQPGDTLWKIANKHYDDSHDIRVVIAEIKAYNELNGAVIHPGETLQLPQ